MVEGARRNCIECVLGLIMTITRKRKHFIGTAIPLSSSPSIKHILQQCILQSSIGEKILRLRKSMKDYVAICENSVDTEQEFGLRRVETNTIK